MKPMKPMKPMKSGSRLLLLLLLSQVMTSQARAARHQPEEEQLSDFRKISDLRKVSDFPNFPDFPKISDLRKVSDFSAFLSQILHSADMTFGTRDYAVNVSTFLQFYITFYSFVMLSIFAQF
jgi:hypothetical protein